MTANSFHFSDEQVMAVVGDVGNVMRWNLESRLRLMTTGEKWTLYRAIVKLAEESRPQPEGAQHG